MKHVKSLADIVKKIELNDRNEVAECKLTS